MVAPRVLLCARGGTPELPAEDSALIMHALRARGAEPIALDSFAFPTHASASISYGASGEPARWLDHELREITAIWQSLVVGGGLPAMAPGERETCVLASELAVLGLLDSLDVFQLDPYWHKARADHKPAQLRLARRLGLDVPETLITNDAGEVRAFARRVGPVITKMLVQPQPTGPADGTADIVFTTALDADALDALDGLELCPMIFQAQIASLRDVRVTVAGRRVIAATLEAGQGPRDSLDWRRDSYTHDRAAIWQPYDLPAGLGAQVGAMLDHHGLSYGAADFVVGPDGRHVFLELNASGAFAFLGDDLAPRIAGAVADTLIDPAHRRTAR
ncbi:MAG TPA: hypothetical protein VGC42_26060 [Kofleriaceae bacterium]